MNLCVKQCDQFRARAACDIAVLHEMLVAVSYDNNETTVVP
jgi:hypothetical protein